MAAIRTLNPTSTYKEFIDSLITFVTPPNDCSPKVVGIINDCYLDKSTKACTRSDRGQPGPNVKLQSVHQRMLIGMRWKEFLHNGKNKQELINLISTCLQLTDGRKHLTPFIINNKYDNFEITSSGGLKLFSCNYEEADYRIILHALLSNQDAVVVRKDVFFLLVCAYNHFNIQFRHLSGMLVSREENNVYQSAIIPRYNRL